MTDCSRIPCFFRLNTQGFVASGSSAYGTDRRQHATLIGRRARRLMWQVCGSVHVLTGMHLACSKHQRWRTLPDLCAADV